MSTEVAERPLTHAQRGAMSSGNQKYTPAQVERGLQAAAVLGNAETAAAELKMPAETLRYWCRKSHRDRYLAIRAELAPKIHEQIAAETEDLALELIDGTREALTRTRDAIPNLAGKDAAAATKNLTFALNTAVDKSLLIRGKPTSIVRHDVNEDIRALAALGVITVDSTSEDITDAQVAED